MTSTAPFAGMSNGPATPYGNRSRRFLDESYSDGPFCLPGMFSYSYKSPSNGPQCDAADWDLNLNSEFPSLNLDYLQCRGGA